ncbi:MAG: DUF1330 domain-containing protein [Gammaproteobacteria bacterium]
MTRWYIFYESDRALSVLARFVDIVRYSITPYDGRILVNGGQTYTVHGDARGPDYQLLVEFPHRDAAEAWYQSALFGLILEKACVWPDGRFFMMEGAA